MLDDKDATKKMQSFGDTTGKTESKLGSFVGKIGGMAKTAMIGFAGAVVGVGSAMVGVTSKALETTSTINKFADTCNVSTTEYQKLDGVMKQVGWSMENAAGDFAMLSEKMYEAATTGEGEAYEMFQKLGVETTNLDGSLRNTGDVFNDMILSLQNVGDETERQAIASIMLGTTSEELAPILKMTNEEFLAMKENVKVIDEEQLQKAEEFKQSWDRLKQSFSAVVTEIGVALMPIFQTLADWVVEHMPQIQEVIEIAFSVVTEIIKIVVEAIEGVIQWFTNLLENNTELGEELTVIWETVNQMFQTVFKEVQELINAFISWATKFWNKYGDDIISVTKNLWEVIKTLFSTTFDVLMELINFFTAMLQGDFDGMSQAITNIVESMWKGIKNLFNTGISFITNLAPTLFKAGCDLFNNLWKGLQSVWDGIADWISDKVSWITDKLMFWRDAEKEMSKSSKGGSKSQGRSIAPMDVYAIERMERSRQEQNNYTYTTTNNNTQNAPTTIIINAPTGNAREISRQVRKDLDQYDRARGVK